MTQKVENMKKIVSRFIMAVALVVAFVSGTTANVEAKRGLTTQEKIVHRTAIIRLGPTGPYFHTNSIHDEVGARRVGIAGNGCDIVVLWNGKRGSERILSAIVDEDETVSRLDVKAGYSGNIDRGVIKMYRAGQHVCANDPIFGKYANLWVEVTSLKLV